MRHTIDHLIIGDRLTRLMAEHGLCAADVARMLDGGKSTWSSAAVRKWMIDESQPSAATLVGLADILGCSLDYLMTGKAPEIIGLDDMDAQKRAMYLIERDDVENFKKYKNNEYFIDEKIPQDKRKEMLLLADGSHILWVVGKRISDGYKITKDTKNVIEIQYDGGIENGKTPY